MSSYLIGLLVGIGAGLLVLAVTKFRTRNRPMSVAEQAEFLSKRRARMLPALAAIFLAQQASYFSTPVTAAPRPVDTVKISAWLVLSIVLLAALATKGFWAHSREATSSMTKIRGQTAIMRCNRVSCSRWGRGCASMW